jgi:hypothetical protein
MAKNGEKNMFDMGEIDLLFGDKNLTVKYPNRTQDIYDVATTGGSTLIIMKGNETIHIVNNVLAYLKHTTSMGLSTYGPGKSPPDSFKTGMWSDKALSMTMWKCNSWAGVSTCAFDHIAEEKPKPVAIAPPKNLEKVEDECNEYGDCKSCLKASGDVKCGWCLGGTLEYEGVGKTPYKCGGFK